MNIKARQRETDCIAAPLWDFCILQLIFKGFFHLVLVYYIEVGNCQF